MAGSMRVLRNIAVVGGFVALGGAGYFTVKIQNRFRDADYYKQSMTLLRNYAPIEASIGRPITGQSVNLGDFENNKVDGLNAKIAIPVSGPKGKGTLFCFASRQDVKDSWQIDQLDIEAQKTNQRWTFYKTPNAGSDPAETSEVDPPESSPPETSESNPPVVSELVPPESNPPEVSELVPPEISEFDPPVVSEVDPPVVSEFDPPESNPPMISEVDPPVISKSSPPETSEVDPPVVSEVDPPQSNPPVISEVDPPVISESSPPEMSELDLPEKSEPIPPAI